MTWTEISVQSERRVTVHLPFLNWCKNKKKLGLSTVFGIVLFSFLSCQIFVLPQVIIKHVNGLFGFDTVDEIWKSILRKLVKLV